MQNYMMTGSLREPEDLLSSPPHIEMCGEQSCLLLGGTNSGATVKTLCSSAPGKLSLATIVLHK